MFDKTSPGRAPDGASGELNAFLNKGSEFEGKLSFDGSVRIDGVFNGEIGAKGELKIGESGKIQAEIKVGSITVSGQIIGNIYAERRVELTATARIKGDIHTPKLVICEGATFDGSVKMATAGGGKGPAPSEAKPKADDKEPETKQKEKS